LPDAGSNPAAPGATAPAAEAAPHLRGHGAPEAGPLPAPAGADTAPTGLVIATRGSTLALAQARLVQAALSAAEGGDASRIMPLPTRGDRAGGDSNLVALARTSPGLFTAEIAAAVRDGVADAAVHSLKDLPLEQPPGLCLAAILPRAAAQDVLVIAPRWFEPEAPLGLRPGATVGTSSPRRTALLRHYAPEALASAVRGNVPTRLRRCREGGVAALLLARAGLQRLGAALADLRLVALPPEQWAPAPGQGAVAVQVRRGSPAAARLATIDHAPSRTATSLERALLQALGGGCGAACGALAAPAGARRWVLRYGFDAAAAGETPVAGAAGGWRSFRLTDTAAGCSRAIAAWAGGEAPPGTEETEKDAHWSLIDEP